MSDSNSTEKKGVEKRRFIRFPFTFPLKHRAAGETQYSESQSDNISLGGVMFFSNVEYALDQELELELHYMAHEKHEPFGVKANVRWVQTANTNPPEFLVGVQFTEMDAHQQAQVEKLVEESIEYQSKMND